MGDRGYGPKEGQEGSKDEHGEEHTEPFATSSQEGLETRQAPPALRRYLAPTGRTLKARSGPRQLPRLSPLGGGPIRGGVRLRLQHRGLRWAVARLGPVRPAGLAVPMTRGSPLQAVRRRHRRDSASDRAEPAGAFEALVNLGGQCPTALPSAAVNGVASRGVEDVVVGAQESPWEGEEAQGVPHLASGLPCDHVRGGGVDP